MTFAEYLTAVFHYYGKYAYQRMGQAYFNVLRDERPDLASMVPQGIDPFYNDVYIPPFLAYVAQNW